MADQALSDMKVIDLTSYIAGPACTKRLADYGAQVIKIERPGVGDGARNMGPFYHNEPNPEKSGLFLYLNTNKRGITLNLKSPMGKEIFLEQVKKADVVVESFRPGVMERLGLGYDELEKLNPKLVMTSISNFGQTGPYRDYEMSELVAFGMGGPMYSKGIPEREPERYGETPSIYGAGAVAAMATTVAFYGMKRFGQGEYIDISIMETQVSSHDGRLSGLVTYQYTGKPTSRGGVLIGRTASGTYPCADGYVFFSSGGPRLERVTRMMGNPPELMDPKFYAPEARLDPALSEEYDSYFISWLMQHTKLEIFLLGQQFGNICSPVDTIDEVFEDPQIKFRGVFTEIDHPAVGKLTYPGRPFIMHESPWAIKRPAPLLGQHNLEVYTELGFSQEDMVNMKETGII